MRRCRLRALPDDLSPCGRASRRLAAVPALPPADTAFASGAAVYLIEQHRQPARRGARLGPDSARMGWR